MGSSEYQQLHKKYYEFLLQHGISTFYEQPVYPYPDGLFQQEGEDYLRDPRASTLYAPYYSNKSSMKRVLGRYRALGVWDKHYFYPTDEPSTRAHYDELHSKVNLMRSIHGDVRIVVPYWRNPEFGGRATSELIGYCDIWCPITDLWDRDSKLAGDLAKARTRGETVWNYVATGPGYPYCNFMINYAGLELRMWLWQTYLYDTTGILYWCSNYWDVVSDPWTDPNTVGDAGAYGGGSMLYPGKKVGVDGPVGSIRLKLIRDGLEDYDYLWLLEQKIGRSAVLPYVQRLATSWSRYTRDTALFETVRDEIAREIEK